MRDIATNETQTEPAELIERPGAEPADRAFATSLFGMSLAGIWRLRHGDPAKGGSP